MACFVVLDTTNTTKLGEGSREVWVNSPWEAAAMVGGWESVNVQPWGQYAWLCTPANGDQECLFVVKRGDACGV